VLLISCPWCGERDEVEFHYGGESHIAYPDDPEAITDDAWGEFLFVRNNPSGEFRERWLHTHGCRRWFNLLRDTSTHEIVRSYRMGESPDQSSGAERESD
jgi:heterotetrameric sarcosine oxidase delta subunit